MKKTIAILAFAALLFVGNANAQLGVNFGYAPQKVTTVNGNWHDTVSMDGFFVGINYNQPLGSGFNVSVGLQGRFNTKSEEENLNLGILGSATAKSHKSQMLIDVPVLFNYGFQLKGDAKLTLFAGPTISYAVFGKTKWDANANVLGALNLGSDGEDDWYEENDKYNKFDLSATVGACFSFSKFRVYGGYNMGMLNLSSADNTTRKSSNWFIGLGYAL